MPIAKENVLLSVERMVCNIVNGVLAELRPDIKVEASVETLYDGKKNIPYARILARGFSLRTMKDVFGFSYATIANHAGMKKLSVMKNVRKVRTGIFVDSVMKVISDEIQNRIEIGLI